MLWMLLSVFSLAQADPVRICVSESVAASCFQMAEDLPETFNCVVAPDIFGCVKKVREGEADVTNVDSYGLYLAGKYFNLRPVVTELVDRNPFIYRGIALVSKDDPSIQSAADLKGRRSCHTTYRRTAGWQIPVGKLLYENIMEPSCDESELATVDNFFSESCVPGNWTGDPIADTNLKKKFSNLCSICKDPSRCAEDDTYAGYEGVIRCISDGAADVGFTKIPVLREYLKKDPSLADKAELLCFDGGRKSVNDPDPCIWGTRPSNSFVIREESNEEETGRIESALLDTQTLYSVPQVRVPGWYRKSFLSHPDVSGIQRTVEKRRTYRGYLDEFINAIRKPRPGCTEEQNNINFCVNSEAELRKCLDYSKAAESRSLFPKIQCLLSPSIGACMEGLQEGYVDLLVVNGANLYKGGRYFDLQPLAKEVYNGSDVLEYAVAVIPSSSNVTKLSELKGLRSCHTGFGFITGWIIPVGALLSEAEMSVNEEVCNPADAVADFFSGGSCVPGANNSRLNPGQVRSEDLCRHCVGDDNGRYKCNRDSGERYNLYDGSLRCLAEGKGDVAFIKNTTIQDYTDGRSELPWAKNLSSSDFKLLCGGGGTASPSEYLECNLGKVPAIYVVTRSNIPKNRRCKLLQLLADSSRYFSDNSEFYKLFRRRSLPDVLFKNTATGLKILTPFTTYEEALGQKFMEAAKAADPEVCVRV